MPLPTPLRTYLRSSHIAGVALIGALAAAAHGQTATSIGDGFDPNANGIVNSVVLQPDGKILVGGYFTQLQPAGQPVSSCPYIARLNHNGTVDASFTPAANAAVRTLVLQPNGQILVAGSFTTLQSTGGAAVARNYAGRLNPDGTVDTVFNPNPNGIVYAFAYQPNGQIIIGGAFTSVAPNGGASVARNHIARFNADGSLDTTFDPNTDKPVLALGLEPNGQIVVGGGFSTFTPNGASAPTTRSCVARLNPDGSLDPVYDPEANGSVQTILILPDGRIVLGGEFTGFQPPSQASITQIDFLARFTATGAIDTSFVINPLASVQAVALQSDGRLVIGGTFTSVVGENSTSSATADYVARINNDGSLDETFAPNPNQAVNSIAIEPDGGIIVGGFFSAFNEFGSVGPISRNFIARIQPAGLVDASLAPDDLGAVFASAQQSNGQVLIGGSFLSVNGTTHAYLARLNADGSLDTQFLPTTNGPVQVIALQSNGDILIGGLFSEVDGVAQEFIARLNPDGTLDKTFNPNPNGEVTAITLQSNGQILIGGSFSAMDPNGASAVYSINAMARLNTDGSLDTSFNPSPGGGNVFAIAIQPDGRIVVGGEFTSMGGQLRSFMARIDSNGNLDGAPFDPEPSAGVYSIVIQPDSKVLIGGAFVTLFPQTGKIGTNTTTQGPYGPITLPSPGTSASVPIYVNHLARLNTDGTFDATFQPDPSDLVLAMALQSDGSVISGGQMTSFAQNGNPTGTLRNRIGRVSSTGVLDPTFNPNADGQVDVIQILSNGNVLIAGSFTTLQPNGAAAPIPAEHVAILNSNGTLASFSAGTAGATTGAVTTAAFQSDGRLLVGGTFAPLAGTPGSYFGRFNPDGSPDTGYNPTFNGPVNAIAVEPNAGSNLTQANNAIWLESTGAIRHAYIAAVNGQATAIAQQSDGSVLVGGAFSTFGGQLGFNNIVRLMPDGTLDASFNPGVVGQVDAIVVQPADGKIVVAGQFMMIGSSSINYLARLNSDGTLDTSFFPSPNGEVTSLALDSMGRIVAGGSFNTVEIGAPAPVGRNYIARFNADGSVDPTFNPNLNNPVSTVAIASNGQILAGGQFSTAEPNGATTTTNVNGIVRLNTDGTVDTAFFPDPNSTVDVISIQPNGQILVGGAFTAFAQNGSASPVTANYMARLNTDGSLDTTFNPDPNGLVLTLAQQANGQILVGGVFTTFSPNKAALPVTRHFIARLNADGSLDTSFDPQVNSAVSGIKALSDGSIFVAGDFNQAETGASLLVGGSFTSVGGTAAPNLVRLNNDGTADTSFNAFPNGPVDAVTFIPGGQALVGGAFTEFGSLARAGIAMIDTNGSVDPSFNPGANGTVEVIALQTNGAIVVGGAYSGIAGSSAANLARLTPSGALDTSFNPSVNGEVDTVVVQANGQIVIGGAFTSVSGMAVGGVARLNSDGSADSTFNPDANGTVKALTLQADGTLLAAGTFTTIGGLAIPYAARIEPNGGVDSTFTPDPNAAVYALAVGADGKMILGGSFTVVEGLPRFALARLTPTTAVVDSVTASSDLTSLSWTQQGPGPTFSSVLFEESPDDVNWTVEGQGSTANGTTWTIGGLAPPSSGTFYVRATGVALSSVFSSSGLVQTIQAFYAGAMPEVNSVGNANGNPGAPFSFAVTATQAPKSFSASGLPPGLSINPATGVISGVPTAAGTYRVTVTASNSGGSTSSTLVITIGAPGSTYVSAAGSSSDRLLNLSSRDMLAGSQTLIAGFVIAGTAPKTVILRAVGPGLASFNLTGVMQHPELQLFSNSGAAIATNTGWGGSSSLAAAFAQAGAFALAPTSADAGIETSLAPGAYTLHVFDASGAGGIVLTEIYDASATPLTDPERLINISARGSVSGGSGALIGGFVVSGSATKSVLIRGIGPGLAPFGVTGPLSDPVLSVYDSSGNLLAMNRGWSTQVIAGPDQADVTAADIASADSQTGAFALTAGSADTALIVNLPPGAYTFQVTSAGNGTGEALGEVYELP